MTRVPERAVAPGQRAFALLLVAVLAVLAVHAPSTRAPEARRVTPAPRAVDISRARVEELCLLEGVGPALAARLVAYRAVHGPFATLDEALAVKGVGPATLEAMRRGARAGAP